MEEAHLQRHAARWHNMPERPSAPPPLLCPHRKGVSSPAPCSLHAMHHCWGHCVPAMLHHSRQPQLWLKQLRTHVHMQ